MSIFGSFWDIVLSGLLPVFSALLIFLISAKGPLAPIIRATTGVVGPYFNAVAILFGLFAALLASDVWQKTNEAKRAVLAESHAVETLAYISRASGLEAQMIPLLKAYAKAASAEDPYTDNVGPAKSDTDKAYLAILTSITTATGIDSTIRAGMLTSAHDLLRAHGTRLNLANDVTAPIKWVAMIIMGVLTQIALLMVHVDNQRAMRAAVGLFTISFSFCLVVVTIFDAPFDVVLAHEPAASLKAVLEGF